MEAFTKREVSARHHPLQGDPRKMLSNPLDAPARSISKRPFSVLGGGAEGPALGGFFPQVRKAEAAQHLRRPAFPMRCPSASAQRSRGAGAGGRAP